MIVYYASFDNDFNEQIDSLSSCLFDDLEYFKDIKSKNAYVKCPAFQDYIKNVFVIRSPFDYTLSLDKENEKLHSSNYDQGFFDRYVVAREIKFGIFSLLFARLIFFSEKNIIMEQFTPFFHNSVGKNVVIPGKFNIGKHFRPVECALHCFKSGNISIKEKDVLYYLKFDTDEKIVFKKFYMSEKLIKLSCFFNQKRLFTKKILPLKWYYDNSISKQIIKEIKQNLIT